MERFVNKAGSHDGAHARVRTLSDPESDDLSDSTTAEERIEMVGLLSRRMWELSGRSLPDYTRSDIPAKVLRPE